MSEGLQKRVRERCSEWVNEYLLKLAVSEGLRHTDDDPWYWAARPCINVSCSEE